MPIVAKYGTHQYLTIQVLFLLVYKHLHNAMFVIFFPIAERVSNLSRLNDFPLRSAYNISFIDIKL